ncbi:DNA primase (plasmid) [Nostoc flagelliforme CCNUN1]|uniref:DNA primase n=1 Tax=Nostoc flagelliforme CCNUN1 TaxID=2038116 RepID=A0A2K8T9Y1_9NOSO|nr:DNA primase [Nostoc flagelliforme CCNUN1]
MDYVGRLGSRDNRECVYQFVLPDDERDLIFQRWLNRDEASQLANAQNAVLPNPFQDWGQVRVGGVARLETI